MALIHHFLLVSSDINNLVAPFRELYVLDGFMQRYANFESVPRPINIAADSEAGDILMAFYKDNQVRAVSVHDKYILKNLTNFNCVETYYTGFVPCMGLNYYGFTLIPWESLPVFTSICMEHSTQNCFAELISLCKVACSAKCDILHCGI